MTPIEQQHDTPYQESIFDEKDLLSEGYDKHMKQARNALFLIAGFEVISGIVSSFQANSSYAIADIWIEALTITAIFIGLAFWTKKKPYTALLIGLILFVAYQLFYIIIAPENIVRGLVMKVIIVVYLIKGLTNAREAQRIKKVLGTM